MKNYEKVVEILEKHLDDEGIFYGEIASEICDLFSVVGQRELLIAAAKGIYPNGDQKQLTKLIDRYLQGN